MNAKRFLVIFGFLQTIIIKAADPSAVAAAQLAAKAELTAELFEAVQDPVTHSAPNGQLKRLIGQGADPMALDKETGMSPLMFLIDRADHEGAKELLAAYQEPLALIKQEAADGDTALIIAALARCGGDSEEVYRLLQQYVEPSSASAVKAATKVD